MFSLKICQSRLRPDQIIHPVASFLCAWHRKLVSCLTVLHLGHQVLLKASKTWVCLNLKQRLYAVMNTLCYLYCANLPFLQLHYTVLTSKGRKALSIQEFDKGSSAWSIRITLPAYILLLRSIRVSICLRSEKRKMKTRSGERPWFSLWHFRFVQANFMLDHRLQNSFQKLFWKPLWITSVFFNFFHLEWITTQRSRNQKNFIC